MAEQLSLDIALKDEATFENFYSAHNETAVMALQAVITSGNDDYIYLWGANSVGRTHLLQACCHAMALDNQSVMYLPLNDAEHFSPKILEGMENLSLIALDDIDSIAGNTDWEEALFHFYNRCKETGAKLLVTAQCAPRQLDIALPDLLSRLSQGLIFHLDALTDEQKIEALIFRAHNRGLEMPADVANYLLKRCPRDMNALFDVLDKDRKSVV